MKKIVDSFSSSIEDISLDIDNLAEVVFKSLLKECRSALGLEKRIYQFDKYFDENPEIVHLKQIIGHRVRTLGKAYLDEIKSQHKIVLGE